MTRAFLKLGFKRGGLRALSHFFTTTKSSSLGTHLVAAYRSHWEILPLQYFFASSFIFSISSWVALKFTIFKSPAVPRKTFFMLPPFKAPPLARNVVKAVLLYFCTTTRPRQARPCFPVEKKRNFRLKTEGCQVLFLWHKIENRAIIVL